MRKIFSLAALAMLCSSAMNVQAADTAEGDSSTFDYTLAYDYAGAFQSQAFKLGGTVYQAFIIDAYNADLYADTEITSINITAGNYKGEKVNKVKNVTVFLAEDLDSEPFYTQSGKLGDEGEVMYKVALDKPYKIEKGKPVVVGYSFRLSSSDINYITVDNTYHENMAGGWIGYKYGDAAIQWENISHTYGNLCIGCTLKGESFPQNGVAVLSLDGAEFAEPGKNFEYTVYFQNTAANTVNSMEVSYTIGDGTKKTGQVNLRNPLKYNERSGLKFSDLSYGKEGIDVPVTFEITKVNGEANISDENKRTGYLNCFNAANGFKRVHLMEEGTGTWCQWCPAGIVMMDNLAKNYPEDYALVGVHYNDAMQVTSTAPVLAMFGGSYPNSYIDRSVNIMPTMATVNQTLKAFTEYYREIPALVGFPSIKGVKTEDGKLKVNTDVQFALDLRGASRYRLSYYIVEDGVGPYEQQNGFAGGESGPMGGWESKGLYVSTLFNDVARYLEGGMEGVQGSIPGSVKQGESYSYEVELPLTNVTKDKVRVVAFVVDTTTGTVVNAAQKEVDLTESGVEEIADASSSEILSKTYYTLNGVEVKDPSNGIYILRTVYADGTVKAEKVVVE